MKRDTFSTYNPLINFIFFIGAVALGMFFLHPALLCCSLLLSSAYYLTIHRRRGLKFLAAMIPLFVVLAAVNPLFNPNGQTVLFVYLGGRPYTLEALIYGAAIAAMFISILIWFACYNAVMTSDKFLYIFGRTAPAISLVLSMILRLVPGFQRKAGQIAGRGRHAARKDRKRRHRALYADDLGAGGRNRHGRQHEKPGLRQRKAHQLCHLQIRRPRYGAGGGHAALCGSRADMRGRGRRGGCLHTDPFAGAS